MAQHDTTLDQLDAREEYLLQHPMDRTGWVAIPIQRRGLEITRMDVTRTVPLGGRQGG